MRKLILLALGGAAVAYLIKSRAAQGEAATPSTTGYAPSAEAPSAGAAAAAPGADAPTADSTADTAESEAVPAQPDPEARFDQTENAPTGEGAIPDTSDEDPLVREQEQAAAAEAGSVGGPADTATASVEPEMRPVVEGSGDAEETFEETEDQGR